MNISLADYIRSARIENKLTQRGLAKKAGINNTMISRIENGITKKPSYKVLKQIAEALDIELLEVLTVAKYTGKELQALGLITEYWGIKGTDIIEDYLVNDDNRTYIDLIKVLEGYRKGKMKIDELFGLLSIRTGIDFTKYIPKNQKKEYGLDNMIETNIKELEEKEE